MLENIRLIKSELELAHILTDADKAVAVFFYSAECPDCREVASLTMDLARKYGDVVSFFKLDVDLCPDLKEAHHIELTPTLIVFRSGDEHRRLVAGKEMRVYEDALDSVCSAVQP